MNNGNLNRNPLCKETLSFLDVVRMPCANTRHDGSSDDCQTVEVTRPLNFSPDSCGVESGTKDSMIMTHSVLDVRSPIGNPDNAQSGNTADLQADSKNNFDSQVQENTNPRAIDLYEVKLNGGDHTIVRQTNVSSVWYDAISNGKKIPSKQPGDKTKRLKNVCCGFFKGKCFGCDQSHCVRVFDKDTVMKLNRLNGLGKTILCKEKNCQNRNCKFAHDISEVSKSFPRIQMDKLVNQSVEDKFNWKRLFPGNSDLYLQVDKDATFIDEIITGMWRTIHKRMDDIRLYESAKDHNDARGISRMTQLDGLGIPSLSLENYDKIRSLYTKWSIGLRSGTEVTGYEFLNFEPMRLYPEEDFLRNEIVELFLAGFNEPYSSDRFGPNSHVGLPDVSFTFACWNKESRPYDCIIESSRGSSQQSLNEMVKLVDKKRKCNPSKKNKEDLGVSLKELNQKMKLIRSDIEYFEGRLKKFRDGKVNTLMQFYPEIPEADTSSSHKPTYDISNIRIGQRNWKSEWKSLGKVDLIHGRHGVEEIVHDVREYKDYYDADDWSNNTTITERRSFVTYDVGESGSPVFDFSNEAKKPQVWMVYFNRYYKTNHKWSDLVEKQEAPTFGEWCHRFNVVQAFDEFHVEYTNWVNEQTPSTVEDSDGTWNVQRRKPPTQPTFCRKMTRIIDDQMKVEKERKEFEDKQKIEERRREKNELENRRRLETWRQTDEGRVSTLHEKVARLKNVDGITKRQKNKLSETCHKLEMLSMQLEDKLAHQVRESDNAVKQAEIEQEKRMQKKEFYGPKSKKLTAQERTKLKKNGNKVENNKDSEATVETGRRAWIK